jgi:hypothetical protein
MLLDLNGHALRISSAPIPACILAACTKLVTAIVGGIMVSEIGNFLLPQRPNIRQGPEGDIALKPDGATHKHKLNFNLCLQ